MTRRWKNETYLKLRRWVDRDVSAYPHHSIAFQGALIAMGILLFGAHVLGGVTILGFWLVVFPTWAMWTVFVLWRVVRISRAAMIKGDRGYDQKTRYILPPEYADSESVLTASRRGRRRRR